MATIKQLEKQIETANKRLNKMLEGVEKRTATINKQLDKYNKKNNTNITLDTLVDAWNNRPNKSEWDEELYKPYSNLNMIEDKAPHRRYEERLIQRLTKELNELQDKEENRLNDPLIAAFCEVMKDFKEEYRIMFIEYHTNLHREKQAAKQGFIDRIEELKKLYGGGYKENFSSYYEFSKAVVNAENKLNHICYKLNEADYITQKQGEFEDVWLENVIYLAERCKELGLKETENFVMNCPEITSRGFKVEVYQNGTTYDARMIYAAEYSVYVCPHYRYIVTKRKS